MDPSGIETTGQRLVVWGWVEPYFGAKVKPKEIDPAPYPLYATPFEATSDPRYKRRLPVAYLLPCDAEPLLWRGLHLYASQGCLWGAMGYRSAYFWRAVDRHPANLIPYLGYRWVQRKALKGDLRPEIFPLVKHIMTIRDHWLYTAVDLPFFPGLYRKIVQLMDNFDAGGDRLLALAGSGINLAFWDRVTDARVAGFLNLACLSQEAALVRLRPLGGNAEETLGEIATLARLRERVWRSAYGQASPRSPGLLRWPRAS